MIEISTPENELKHGDWVYTPNEVFGSSGKEHNIFQYDERINYSLDFTNPPVFYRILPPQQVKSVDLADVVGQSEQLVCDIEKGTRCNDSFPSYKDGKCHNCGGQAN